MLSNLESAPVRIIKPHLFSAARASASSPSSSGPSGPLPPLAATGDPGPAPASAGPRADQPRMATIQEDNTSSDSMPPPDDELPEGAVFPLPSDPLSTAHSFQDLNEQQQGAASPARGDRKRLKRQACLDNKETEC